MKNRAGQTIEIVRGTPKERKEILRFIDYVFSKNSRPHDFKTMLPKLFLPNTDYEKYAYMIKENHRIEALIYAVPLTVAAGEGDVFKAKVIGMVSVDPDARGKGYMKALMNRIHEDMIAEKCDFAVLGGQRQRYEYFGYEPAGHLKNIQVTATNIRHAVSTDITGKYTFFKLEENPQWIPQAFCLYDESIKQSFGCIRKEDEFLAVLQSWKNQPYAIVKENQFLGYLTCCFRDNILIVEEFYLKSGENIKEIVKALFGLAGKMSLDESDLIKSIIFKVGPYQMDLSAELSSLCESYSVFGEQAYCILDFEHVVQTLLRKKHLLNPLQEGTLNLHIQEYGVLSIKIYGKDVRVEKREDILPNQAHFSLSQLEATGLLFSQRGEELPHSVPSGWFPIKLCIPHTDLC